MFSHDSVTHECQNLKNNNLRILGVAYSLWARFLKIYYINNLGIPSQFDFLADLKSPENAKQ